MKFAIAAGILAQTLPTWNAGAIELKEILRPTSKQGVLSRSARRPSQSLSTKNPIKNIKRKRTESRTIPSRWNQNTDLCDPFSDDPDIGILSCRGREVCSPSNDSVLGGKCVRNYFSKENAARVKSSAKTTGSDSTVGINDNGRRIECNPFVADIGILSSDCKDGQYCAESVTSELGGVCTGASSLPRHLFTVGLCDPDSIHYQLFYCDCNYFDSNTNTGRIDCIIGEYYSAGYYYDGCDETIYDTTATYVFEASELIESHYCFEFSAPYYQKVCSMTTTATCEVEFNGESCSSCTPVSEDYFDFDCSNVQGGQAGSFEGGILDFLPIIDSCYIRPPMMCPSLCGNNSYIPRSNFDINVTVSGIWDVSCENLAYADYYSLVPDYLCEAAQEAAQGACCVSLCSLCPGNGYVPQENYASSVAAMPDFYGTSCEDFVVAAYSNFSFSSSQCPQVQALMEKSCCNKTKYESCNICGEEDLTAPAENVTLGSWEVPCAELDAFAQGGSLSDSQCIEATSIASSICCGNLTGSKEDTLYPTYQPCHGSNAPSSFPTENATFISSEATDMPSTSPTAAPTHMTILPTTTAPSSTFPKTRTHLVTSLTLSVSLLLALL